MITVSFRSQSKIIKSPQKSPQKKQSKIKTFRKKFTRETLKVQISHELHKVSIYPNSQLYLRSPGVCPHITTCPIYCTNKLISLYCIIIFQRSNVFKIKIIKIVIISKPVLIACV